MASREVTRGQNPLFDLLTANPAPADTGQRPLFTPAGLARYLAVSTSTLQRWRRSGRLPVPDLANGRILRWDPETITAWLKSRKPRTTRRAASPSPRKK